MSASTLYEFDLRRQQSGLPRSRRAAERYAQLQALRSRPPDVSRRRPTLLRRLVRVFS